MKRIFRFLFFLLVLIFGAAFILPIVFKDSLVERIKQEANANLNARLDFEDVDVSLISSFPYFGFSLQGLEITGLDEFEGQKLLSAGDFTLSIDLMSVISGETYTIEKIAVEDFDLQILVLEDGLANYDIAIAGDSTAVEESSAESSAFHLALSAWKIENFNLSYVDQQGDMEFHLHHLNQNGKGNFTESVVDLTTTTEAQAMSFVMEGVKYLNRVHLESDFAMAFDMDKFRFDFGENRVALNGLALNFEGWVSMPNEAIDMDLKFHSPENSFKSLISLIPAIYYQDFNDLKSSGEFKLNGLVQGRLVGDIYPSFDINLNVREGYFQYPDLPSAVSEVNIDFGVKNQSRDLSGTEINMPRFAADVAGSKFNASFSLKDPMGDPNFKFLAQAQADLAQMAQALPVEGYEMAGKMDMDLNAAGSLSMIDEERYEDLSAGGAFSVEGIHLGGDSLGMNVDIPFASLQMKPNEAVLGKSRVVYESQELNFEGRLNNLIAYALRDEALSGGLDVYSSHLDLMALMGSEEEVAVEEEGETDTTSMEVIRLPKNVDFAINLRADTVLYDNLTINDARGSLGLKEGTAYLNKVNLDLLGGALIMDGLYDSRPDLPLADFQLYVKGFSFVESYEGLDMVRQLAPVMKNVSGNYDLDMSLNTQMSGDMSPILNSISASGALRTRTVEMGGKVFDQLATFLRNPDYANIAASDINLNFSIEDGKIEVEPFDFKLAGQKASMSGNMSLEQDLDFKIDTDIPLNSVQGNELLGQLQSLSGGSIPLHILIGGKATSPEVRPSLGDFKQNLVDDVKKQVNQAVDSAKTVVKQEVNKKLDELVKAAEAQGDKLIAEARSKGEQLKAEAKKQADKVRAGGETAAQKILDEAGSNPLKQAAARPLAEKAKREANEQAQKIEDEAAKQAGNLIQAAETQKQKLVADAKEKAQV